MASALQCDARNTEKKQSKLDDREWSVLKEALNACIVDALNKGHVPHDESVRNTRGICHNEEQLCRREVRSQLFLNTVHAA
jgi:hypothetical protein